MGDLLATLSDAALLRLAEAFDSKHETGWWSRSLNSEEPEPTVAERTRAGALQIRRGLVYIDPEIATSFAVFNPEPAPKSVVSFGAEFSNQITQLRQ